MDDLDDALTFIIKELKRQEFSELYERAGKGIAEPIVRAMASFDKHELSVAQVSDKIKTNEKNTALVMSDLAKKGILTKVGQGIYKLRDPLFKVYLRWVLGPG